ncbi:MAG: GGDEF domain-containing protein [Lachnospiraceae bacterium]|nr:GGDEF domain-containing protein [Lachnospiraceae bacterium]
MKKPIVLGAYKIIFFIISFIVLVFCFTVEDFTSSVDLKDPMVYRDFSGGWIDNRGKNVDLSTLWSNSNGIINIYHDIPQNIRVGQNLHFLSHNLCFTVYVNDMEVYRFYPKPNITGKGYGDQYHEIDLVGFSTNDIIRMEIDSIYGHEKSGSLDNMALCKGDAYIYRIITQRGVSALISLLIIFFGITMIALQFSSLLQQSKEADMFSLGLTAIFLGIWTLQETSVPNLLIGGSGLFRALDYVMLMLVAYPAVIFVNSISRRRKRIFEDIAFFSVIIVLVLMFGLRFGFGKDMHEYIWIVHISLVIAVIEIVGIVASNHVYCRQQNIKDGMKYFYIGALFFCAGGFVDLLHYIIRGKAVADGGFFLRIGLMLFILTMMVQVSKWMSNERKKTNQDRFINGLLKYSMGGPSPEKNVRNMIEYMGMELHADRAFILEETDMGSFENTYEWCKEGVEPMADQLQNIPFKGVLDAWFVEFNANQAVTIEDMSDYNHSGDMFIKMSRFGVNNLIAGQLTIDGTHIGCFGVENIPKEMIRDIEEIMKLTSFFISVTLRQRNTQKLLRKYSYRDQMTGVMNRRALEEFEEEKLDRSKPYGVLMVDINGLKRMNDVQGHDAGDNLIRDVANALGEVFKKENVYRMGGDEFLAIGFSVSKAAFLQNIKTLQLLLTTKGRSASMGYVYKPEGAEDFEAVKKEADTLMYKDKQRYYEMDANNRRESRS